MWSAASDGTGDLCKRRLAALPSRPAGRQVRGRGPSSSAASNSFSSPRRRDPSFTSGSTTAVSQQVACIVEPGRQIAVVDLLLHQAILHRSVFLFQLGRPLLQLFVLILQVAQARFELADGRAAGQKIGLTGTTRRHAQDGADRRLSANDSGDFHRTVDEAGS